MKAVILAAGIASRLRPLTDTTPKCLLKIGERCLLERAFDALIQNGFDEFIIVTGYRQQQIVDFLQARYPVQNITFIYNDRYESTNNIYSLWLTRPYTDGEEILLLDSDIVFDPQIVKRLLPLQDVGLGYIKLGQASSTLSGGENQRVKLAFYLSQEKADPTMFIFDEPTTGLHFHDIRKLLDAFDALIRRGHSIVIIEHNMDVIKCADYVIDLGPEGGDKGGNIVAVGTPEEVAACGASYTGQFLKEKLG